MDLNNRSKELRTKAIDWMKTIDGDIHYSSIGGSTARGEADEYSDIDLVIYLENDSTIGEQNLIYDGELIQIEMKHRNELPDKNDITAFPWDYRFLNELLIMRDVDGRFKQIKGWAMEYFSSKEGKAQVFNQVAKLVADRNGYALKYLKTNKMYSALHAALGAGAEAALLYQFFAFNDLSTGTLIRNIGKIKSHFHTFQAAAPFSMNIDPSKVSDTLSHYREYLRNQNYTCDFALSRIQDQLFERKAKRLIESKEIYNLLWQAYAEGVWLYFETCNGKDFENYFNELPSDIQEDLSIIGFVSLSEDKIMTICQLSEELLQFADRLK
ncbi:nucleotidyltransferase domain-containing protein [Heyndrickxia sp. NPDC080065]|uniref:nucleotidyltransferase domain-containing protein n=1 Tax=Heyndrickxia sp. NPDC080065 TaxID=3390568 RepID=UPI003D042DA1